MSETKYKLFVVFKGNKTVILKGNDNKIYKSIFPYDSAEQINVDSYRSLVYGGDGGLVYSEKNQKDFLSLKELHEKFEIKKQLQNVHRSDHMYQPM